MNRITDWLLLAAFLAVYPVIGFFAAGVINVLHGELQQATWNIAVSAAIAVVATVVIWKIVIGRR